ncbi:MAG: hypothetical protein JWO56_546, partial [Acidobacteria bacterium]|nr:hypothetical protein [Acidobacteriota bacterium]
RLDLSSARSMLRSGEHFALYVSNEGRPLSRPAIRPVPMSGGPVLVPAEMNISLMIVDEELIVWVSRPLRLANDQVLKLPAFDRPGPDVAVIVSLDRNLRSEDRKALEGMAPPAVHLRQGSKLFDPVLPLRNAPLFDTSLVLFADVPAGNYQVEIADDHWSKDALDLHVDARRATLPQPGRPLVTRPLSVLNVDWSLSASVASAAAERTCDGSRAPKTTLTLSRCPFGFAHTEPVDCSRLAELTPGDAGRGRSAFAGLQAGDYYLELKRGGVTARKRVSVPLAATLTAGIDLDASVLSGRVTRGKRPAKALITFATGSVTSDEASGEYYALVTAAPGTQPVIVAPCDSHREIVDLPQRPLAAGDRYDIHIPENRLEIKVIEEETSHPLVSVQVTRRIVTPAHTLAAFFLGVTDDRGMITDENLSPDATLELCATARGYDRACLGSVRLANAQESVTIALHKPKKWSLRFVTASAAGPGRVYVASASSVLGYAVIDGDRIELDPNTPPNAFLYITARNYPLKRLSMPRLGPEIATMELPPENGIPLSVTLPRESAHNGGPFGIEMGGVPVPPEVVQYYQLIRGKGPLQIRKGQTIAVAPIDSSQPLAILLWHWSADLPADQRVPDPFSNPLTLRNMARTPVEQPIVVLNAQ